MAVSRETRREAAGQEIEGGELVTERLWVARAHSWNLELEDEGRGARDDGVRSWHSDSA
jgi:hypothetical protein